MLASRGLSEAAFWGAGVSDLRSALHPDGADVIEAALLNVGALGSELQTLALEMFLLKHGHLWGPESVTRRSATGD